MYDTETWFWKLIQDLNTRLFKLYLDLIVNINSLGLLSGALSSNWLSHFFNITNVFSGFCICWLICIYITSNSDLSYITVKILLLVHLSSTMPRFLIIYV
jgi:hypothetical protein